MAARDSKRKGRPTKLLPKHTRAPLRQYATALGELVWASNQEMTNFALLFSALVSPDQREIGHAMWLTLSSDKTQLDLFEALVTDNLAIAPDLRGAIQWAITAARNLAAKRNDAVHLATAFDVSAAPVKLVPLSITTLPRRYRRLSGTDLKRMFRVVRDDLHQTGLYVGSLLMHHQFPGQCALPCKPRLQSV